MNYLVNQEISEEVDDSLTGNIIGTTIDVHRVLESAYAACFAYELRLRRLKVEVQKTFLSSIKNLSLTVAIVSIWL